MLPDGREGLRVANRVGLFQRLRALAVGIEMRADRERLGDGDLLLEPGVRETGRRWSFRSADRSIEASGGIIPSRGRGAS